MFRTPQTKITSTKFLLTIISFFFGYYLNFHFTNFDKSVNKIAIILLAMVIIDCEWINKYRLHSQSD